MTRPLRTPDDIEIDAIITEAGIACRHAADALRLARAAVPLDTVREAEWAAHLFIEALSQHRRTAAVNERRKG